MTRIQSSPIGTPNVALLNVDKVVVRPSDNISAPSWLECSNDYANGVQIPTLRQSCFRTMGDEIVATHQVINMLQDCERFYEILHHNLESLILSNPSQVYYLTELWPHKLLQPRFHDIWVLYPFLLKEIPEIQNHKDEDSKEIVLRNEYLLHRKSLKRMYIYHIGSFLRQYLLLIYG